MNKWKVTIIQRQKYLYSENYHEVEIYADFGSAEEATRFASMVIESCADSKVEITYEESNYRDEEKEGD